MNANRDIFPRTPTTALSNKFKESQLARAFPLDTAAAITGLMPTFVKKALHKKKCHWVTLEEVLTLLNLDAFRETFIPRSMIPKYLLDLPTESEGKDTITTPEQYTLLRGDVLTTLKKLKVGSVQCVVTSSPYWAMRIYKDEHKVKWADGEVCSYGHEQTPEGFIRHTVEILFALKPVLTPTASVWWNVMDTYNTRTQIRGNAAETLYAMQGRDSRGWQDYEMRRYSAGHSFLKDGEQCMIPSRIAERASMLGYYVKSMITWKKGQSMPETVESRVTRELEQIIHLSVQRTPQFDKDAVQDLPVELGGINNRYESKNLTDVWYFSTATGKDGHGAQFPIALPARCVALTTKQGDLVLDPFVGSGTTVIASNQLNRRSIGIDVSQSYLAAAQKRIRGERVTAPKRKQQQQEVQPLLLEDLGS